MNSPPSLPTASRTPSAAPSPTGADALSSTRAARPVAVHVPAVDISSDLVELGLRGDGTMEVPADWQRAGWYVHAPRPGEIGPAVIAGHVDSTQGPAVFFRLDELEPEDRITVDRADGSSAVFHVDRVERYPKDAFPTQRVYGDLDHAALRLITCGGAFDDTTGHYRDNVIVFATLAPPDQ